MQALKKPFLCHKCKTFETDSYSEAYSRSLQESCQR